MENNILLERVLSEAMNEDLRKDLVRYLFKSKRSIKGVPRLIDFRRSLNHVEIYERMKSAAEGTGASVARLLGISTQAYHNQKARGVISAKSIISFHCKTGVSLDWLVGSWDGSNIIKEHKTVLSNEPDVVNDDKDKKYLSLVEVYDQHSGNVELKWCLSKQQICVDENNMPIPENFGVLLSLVVRYREQSGTPDKVKSARKRHFQVRRVLAYVLGEPKMIRNLDTKVKKYTTEFRSALFERVGKTEFRVYSSKYDCLKVFQNLAERFGLEMMEPEINTIAWDYLIGPGSMTPQEWILNKLNEYKKNHNLL